MAENTMLNNPFTKMFGELNAPWCDAVKQAAELAHSNKMVVLAGHGLTYRNVRAIASIPAIVELNIGHNIIARAALVGLDRAVRDMVALL